MITNLSIGRYGRFGNMLFQIAAVIGIARKSGQEYGFPPIMNYDHAEKFGSKEDCDLEKYFKYPFPRLQKAPAEYYERPYAWGYHDIYLPKGDWALSGHFQSDKYFRDCMDEVRYVLTMRSECQFQSEPPVAIHVRRGDYDDMYHPRIQGEYYHAAIAKFPKGTRFMVFSDDPDDARRMLGSSPLFTYQTGNDYIRDFTIMKACSGFITANSSFSLMAAILSTYPGKQIICPRTWFGPAWKPSTKDVYPLNSIQL